MMDDFVREPYKPPRPLPPESEIIEADFVTEIVPITAEWWTAFSDAADTLAVFSFTASDAMKAVYKMKSRRRGLPLERGARQRRLKDGRR